MLWSRKPRSGNNKRSLSTLSGQNPKLNTGRILSSASHHETESISPSVNLTCLLDSLSSTIRRGSSCIWLKDAVLTFGARLYRGFSISMAIIGIPMSVPSRYFVVNTRSGDILFHHPSTCRMDAHWPFLPQVALRTLKAFWMSWALKTTVRRRYSIDWG